MPYALARHSSRYAVALTLLATAGPAVAQSRSAALKTLSLEELGKIEVTGARKLPERVWDTAAAIYVITQADIRRSGATTVPDVLRLAPGVLVNQSDANRWAVGVRGFADLFSKGVLVMIDGRSVYTPLVGGVHWAIQDVVLADIERIEIIRGPGGTLWGANAVNGIINIVTAAAGQRSGAGVTLATGIPEHGRLALRYADTLPRGIDYRVYGKAYTRGPQFHPDDANFDGWRSLQAGFRSDTRVTGRDSVMVAGDLYRTRVGERAGVSSFSPPSNQMVDGRLDLTGGNLNVQWQRLMPGSHLRLQSYVDRTNRGGFTFRELRHTWDVDAAARVAAARRHTVSFGGGARISPSRVTQLVPSLNFVPNEQTDRLFHLYRRCLP